MDECDVKLAHEEFQCITTVILAKGLAHECLIGMNVLVQWPAMKEAIRILLDRPPVNHRDINNWAVNPQFARLNNICLPRIMGDCDLKSKLLAKSTPTQALETEVVGVPSQTVSVRQQRRLRIRGGS